MHQRHEGGSTWFAKDAVGNNQSQSKIGYSSSYVNSLNNNVCIFYMLDMKNQMED